MAIEHNDSTHEPGVHFTSRIHGAGWGHARLPVWHPIAHDDAECQGFGVGSVRIRGWFGVRIGTTIAHYPPQTVRERAVESTGRHIGRVDLSPRRSNL